MKFLVKNFTNRESLEMAAKNADPETDTIEGTEEELKVFNLSERRTIYDVPCVLTGKVHRKAVKKVKNVPLEKPNRGEIKKFKLV